MNFLILALALVLGTFLGLAAAFLIKKRSEKDDRFFELVLNQINEIQKSIQEHFKESHQSFEKTTKILLDQTEKFSSHFGKVDEMVKEVQDSLKELSSFQDLFKMPKLRGRWGELYLEHLLAEVLSKDQYQIQYQFKNGNIVDAIIKLPDKRILPIDAKFPVDYFEKLQETENPSERAKILSLFIATVKKEIDEISQKYILPEENTTDFALMYLPAESIFYGVISLKEANLYEYGRSKKVIFVSPNMLYSFLKTILMIQREIQVAQKAQEILKKLAQLKNDAQKLQQSFEKLGKHLVFARNSFEECEKKLNHFVERSERLIEAEKETQALPFKENEKF